MLKKWYVGNVGRVQEARTVGDATVLNFSWASTVGYGDHKKTVWLQCSLWNRDGVYPYITEGSKLGIDGELQPDDYGNPEVYENADGEARSNYKFRVTDVLLLGSSQGTTEQPAQEEEDDIPF